jgi:hypothetical protein
MRRQAQETVAVDASVRVGSCIGQSPITLCQIQSTGAKTLVICIYHRRTAEMGINRNWLIRILGAGDAVQNMGVRIYWTGFVVEEPWSKRAGT